LEQNQKEFILRKWLTEGVLSRDWAALLLRTRLAEITRNDAGGADSINRDFVSPPERSPRLI
jgi:hypothetical protein